MCSVLLFVMKKNCLSLFFFAIPLTAFEFNLPFTSNTQTHRLYAVEDILRTV